jgi:translation initiation factor IF-3
MTQQTYRIRINHFIKVPQVRVIDDEGNTLGVMNTSEALSLAKSKNLDLIEVNPKSFPPVCKILDYGKFKYEEKKKLVQAKKNQKQSEVKEISFHPNTDNNDLNHKLNLAKDFLKDGNNVRFIVKFRGREITHPELGEQKLRWFLEETKELIVNNSQIFLEGKIMSLNLTAK